MQSLRDIQEVLLHHKPALFKKYHLKGLGIFGSATREDFTAESDIDILIEYEGKMGLEFIDLADELEAILKNRVDLVSKNAIKPKMLSRIETDLVYV